jgi:acetyl esterase
VPLHPEVQSLLDAMAAQGMPPFEAMTVPQAREATAAFLDLQPPPEDVASVVDRTVPGPAGEVPVRIYTPGRGERSDGGSSEDGDGPKGVLVYFHGGGWVIGNLETVDGPCRTLANAADVVVVSVDYRLAPEHRHPAAFEDCWAATEWVAAHAAEIGADPARLAVGGDSAGGQLAAAVSLTARDRGGPAIAFQLLIYPVTDFAFDTPSHSENAEGYLLQRATMQWFWAHNLGATDPGKDQTAFPARADSYVGLPPAFVATAEFDPLRDEGEAYAKALDAAGVEVTAQRYDGMIHGFLWTLGATPSGARMVDDAVAAMRPALAR